MKCSIKFLRWWACVRIMNYSMLPTCIMRHEISGDPSKFRLQDLESEKKGGRLFNSWIPTVSSPKLRFGCLLYHLAAGCTQCAILIQVIAFKGVERCFCEVFFFSRQAFPALLRTKVKIQMKCCHVGASPNSDCASHGAEKSAVNQLPHYRYY